MNYMSLRLNSEQLKTTCNVFKTSCINYIIYQYSLYVSHANELKGIYRRYGCFLKFAVKSDKVVLKNV